MDIAPLREEVFDSFIRKTPQFCRDEITKALERLDRSIYCGLDHGRFELIRLDRRTLLTSMGKVTFRRRYYYDNMQGAYCHPLDARIGIPPRQRLSQELQERVLDLASIMTYRETGEHLSDDFAISKHTVWRVIRNASVEAEFGEVDRKGMKVHVQIDEKFVGMVGSKSKRRHYTCTIFAGKGPAGPGRAALLNKTMISSPDLGGLKARVNSLLSGRYGLTGDDEVFVSGDLAQYIQGFGEWIRVCRSRYVPDRFHVARAITGLVPGASADPASLNDAGYLRWLSGELARLTKDEAAGAEARKVKRLVDKGPDAFSAYIDPEYLGCSQEGQNSHYYAPRFGRCASRFSPSTVEKLSIVREARALGAKLVVGDPRRPEPKEVDATAYRPYEEPETDILDTSGMKFGTKKMFDALKYGPNPGRY